MGQHNFFSLLFSLCFAFFLGFLSGAQETSAATAPQLFRAGTKALAKGHYYKAKRLLQQAEKTLSHWGFVQLELARAMQFNGDPASEVAKHLTKATQLIPKNPRVHLFAGLFWEGQNQSSRALKHYALAVQLGNFSPVPCLRAARIWLRQKQAHQALSCLQNLLKSRRVPPESHALLAQAYEQTGHMVKAGTHWMKALSYHRGSLVFLQKVYLYYKNHTPKDPPALRREWNRIRVRLGRELRKKLPKKVRRRLRPLLPSKH